MLVGIRVPAALVDGAREGLDGVPDLEPFLEDEAEVVVELGVVGLDLHRLLHHVHRLAQFLAARERAREKIQRLGMAVVHRHRFTQLQLGRLEVAALHQDAAEPGAIAGILGVELDGLAERLERGVRVPHPPQQRPVLVLERRIGIELDERGLHLLARRGHLALRRERLAHARMCHRIVGVDLQGARIGLPGLVAVSQRQRQLADRLVFERGQAGGGHLEGGVELLLRAGLVVARIPDQALRGERFDQVGLRLQGRFVLAVCLFGFADGVGDPALQVQVARVPRFPRDGLVDRLVRLEQAVLSEIRPGCPRVGRRGCAELDGGLELAGGLVPLETLEAELAVGDAHRRRVRIERHRPLVSRFRVLQIVAARRQAAPQHVRARFLAGIERLANVAVERLVQQLAGTLGIVLPQADRGQFNHQAGIVGCALQGTLEGIRGLGQLAPVPGHCPAHQEKARGRASRFQRVVEDLGGAGGLVRVDERDGIEPGRVEVCTRGVAESGEELLRLHQLPAGEGEGAAGAVLGRTRALDPLHHALGLVPVGPELAVLDLQLRRREHEEGLHVVIVRQHRHQLRGGGDRFPRAGEVRAIQLDQSLLDDLRFRRGDGLLRGKIEIHPEQSGRRPPRAISERAHGANSEQEGERDQPPRPDHGTQARLPPAPAGLLPACALLALPRSALFFLPLLLLLVRLLRSGAVRRARVIGEVQKLFAAGSSGLANHGRRRPLLPVRVPGRVVDEVEHVRNRGRFRLRLDEVEVHRLFLLRCARWRGRCGDLRKVGSERVPGRRLGRWRWRRAAARRALDVDRRERVVRRRRGRRRARAVESRQRDGIRAFTRKGGDGGTRPEVHRRALGLIESRERDSPGCRGRIEIG